MSNPTTTARLSDEQLKFIEPVLEHYQQSDHSESLSERLRTFILAAAKVHPEPPTDAYLEYFLPDPIEGKAFLEKYGADATSKDMCEFVQGRLAAIADGTIQ